MNRVAYITRTANANKALAHALDRLSARFEVPREAVAAPALRGDPEVRRLLELEDLVRRMNLLADAPVREDAADRLDKLSPPAVLSTTDTTRTPEQAQAFHGQPPPPADPVFVHAGFPDNPGPPVVAQPGQMIRDQMGMVRNLPNERVAELQARLGNDRADADREEAEDRQREAERHPPQTVDGMGLLDNPGVPVGVAPGQRVVGPGGQTVSVADEQAEADQQLLAERAREEAEALERASMEREVDEGALKQHPVSPDNPGVPYLLEPGRQVATLVGQDEIAEAERERERVAREEAEALEAVKVEAGGRLERLATSDRSGGAFRVPAAPAGEPPEAETPLDRLRPNQRRALEEAGYGGMEQITAASDDDLLMVRGIGVSTVEMLRGR